MNVKETLIFINRPIGELASVLRFGSKSVEGNEVTYYFEGQGPQGVDFGLFADMDAPDGDVWSHLLMEDPSPGVLAALLKLLHVRPEEVEAATDWNGNPLVDLQAVRDNLTRGNRAAQHERAARSTFEVYNDRNARTRSHHRATPNAAVATLTAKATVKPASKAAARPVAKAAAKPAPKAAAKSASKSTVKLTAKAAAKPAPKAAAKPAAAPKAKTPAAKAGKPKASPR